MSRNRRIGLVLVLLLGIVEVVLGVDAWLRRQAAAPAGAATPLPAGSVPIYFNGRLAGAFTPADLEKLAKASFVEPAENKLQEGWRLRDVLLLYLPADKLTADTTVVVSSASRGKSASLAWPKVQDPANLVMFDLSNRGTLKLVSQLPGLDERDEWVQDADRIEVTSP